MNNLQEITKKYLPDFDLESDIDILVAEDDLVIRRTVEILLKKHGYKRLRLSPNGRDAWQQIQLNPPELIILDYMMPHMSGFEVLQAIRQNHEYDHIPIIFLTAVDDKTKLIEALNSGATDYITKPFDQAELLARVSTHARNYYLQKQLIEINKHLTRMNKELSAKNAQIEADLRSAYKIQVSLLPNENIVNDNFNIHFLYKPCHSVGGDFLNYFQIDDNHLGFYIADVSGHGVTSAMITVFVREQIRNLIKKFHHYYLKPGKILRRLNKIFNQEIYFLENSVYFTIFFGILNIKNKMLSYSSAGHHAMPIIVHANNTIDEITEVDLAIGFEDDFPYRDHQMQLNKSDRLLLHTDGIIEIINKNEEAFGMERIKSFLLANYDMDGNDLLINLIKEGNRFSANAEQKDDIALMLLEIM